MTTVLPPRLTLLLTLALASACGDDDGSTDDAGRDASRAEDAGRDAGNEDAGRDTGAEDAGIEDAGVDAGDDDAGSDDAGFDAGEDAGSDASTPAPYTLYANIGRTLVSFDTATGDLTEIGPTNQDYLVLAWDEEAGLTRVIADNYSPNGGAATPRLGTIDLCTGTITAATPLTEDASPVRRAEGLARDPSTGTWWITYGLTGTTASTRFLSETIGTVDIATGAVTSRASLSTHQDDGDLLLFVGADLYVLDVDTGGNRGSLYLVDLVTGTQMSAVLTGATVLRVAYHPDTDVVFALTATTSLMNRRLGTLALDTGTVTPIGDPLAASVYPMQQWTGAIIARTPTCD